MEIIIRERPPRIERSFSLTIDDENGHVIAEALLTDTPEPFVRKSWQVSLIEVDEQHRRRGLGTRLYEKCRQMAAEHGCALVPSPDMTEEEFALWRVLDPTALRATFTHEDARDFVEEQGANTDAFEERAEIMRKWRPS